MAMQYFVGSSLLSLALLFVVNNIVGLSAKDLPFFRVVKAILSVRALTAMHPSDHRNGPGLCQLNKA